MNTLVDLCRRYTKLTEEDIRELGVLERLLPIIAELTNADVFLDCRLDEKTAVVVGHGRPSQSISAYQNDVVGAAATAEKEPAVFHAFQMGVPVCDLKAITQEDRCVRQNATPVRNSSGQVIGVLIREKDISEGLRQEQKYEELAKRFEAVSGTAYGALSEDPNAVAIREVHHRIKNNLQLVASILNLQSRRSQDRQLRLILQENVNRVLSIAAIHDILTHVSGDMRTIQSTALLDQLSRNLQMLVSADKHILLVTEGDNLPLTADVATSVALVITELVMNALRHAFHTRAEGNIIISVCAGKLFHTITVTDNGTGFDLEASPGDSLGLRIVRATVQDKLKGKLRLSSGAQGTKVSFDFRSTDV